MFWGKLRFKAVVSNTITMSTCGYSKSKLPIILFFIISFAITFFRRYLLQRDFAKFLNSHLASLYLFDLKMEIRHNSSHNSRNYHWTPLSWFKGTEACLYEPRNQYYETFRHLDFFGPFYLIIHRIKVIEIYLRIGLTSRGIKYCKRTDDCKLLSQQLF